MSGAIENLPELPPDFVHKLLVWSSCRTYGKDDFRRLRVIKDGTNEKGPLHV